MPTTPITRAPRSRLVAAGAVLTTCALVGAGVESQADASVPEPGTAAPASTATTSSSVPKAPARKVVARNIDVPWGVVFLPGGGELVGGRDTAKITLVRKNGGKRAIGKVKNVVPNGDSGGEAGLLGLALSPRFKTNHLLYAYISAPHDNRVIRMTFENRRLGKQHVVFKGIPRSLHHNGGRIAFGPDGMLYVTTGEAEVPSRSQKPKALGGHILRMTPNGKPAPGNPFRHSVVYSWGHRNVEGLDWDSRGRLWATEFGDHAWDELNLIKKGHNYGWPIVEGRSSDSRFTNPKAVWRTDQAGPSGIAITKVKGKTVAFLGGLTGQRIWRVTLKGSRVVGKTAWYTGALGRIRTTVMGHGDLWFTTSNTDGRTTPRKGDDKLIRVNIH